MRYLILLYGDPEAEAALSPAARRAIVDEHIAFSRRLSESGALLDGDALEPPNAAKVVRGTRVMDGPFAETKEQLGGFYLLECASLEEALDLAREVPQSPGLAVEVRPLAGVS